MNPISATAQVINAVVGLAASAPSTAALVSILLGGLCGLLLSPAKQNILEGLVMPYLPTWAKYIFPLVSGSLMGAIGTHFAAQLHITPEQAISFAVAITGGTYAWNGSTLAASTNASPLSK